MEASTLSREELLFVYGSLRRGLNHPLHQVLSAHAEFVADAACPGQLFDLGLYPGAVFEPRAGDSIQGEIYRLTDAATVLAALDAYEECTPAFAQPHEFERIRVSVRAAGGGECLAWAYAFRADLDFANPIAGGDYIAFCRTRIRPETAADYDAIDEVNRLAFGGENEVQLVQALRAAGDFDPRLSLVAERDGVVVGHILFSNMVIASPAGRVPAQSLVPVAVRQALQRQGIGGRLVRAGLRQCRELGHRIVVVVGHPAYYPRFGFSPARRHGLEAPFAVPDDAFMVCGLRPGALQGVRGMVRLASAFDPFL